MWSLTNRERAILRRVIPTEIVSQTIVTLPNSEKVSIEKLTERDRISASEVKAINEALPEGIQFYHFVNALRPRSTQQDVVDGEVSEEKRKARKAYRERIEELKRKQEEREYAEMTKSIDVTRAKPLLENFGQEMRQVNRQMIAVINTLITVGGAFAFGFWGVEFAYPHMRLDVATRMLIGLVLGTIVFFADLYFLVRGMDIDGNF